MVARKSRLTAQLLTTASTDPDLWGRCPDCGDDFAVADAQPFAFDRAWPQVALAKLAELKAQLTEQRCALANARHLMTTRASITSHAVNVGKICERIAPSLPGFPHAAGDCRCLLDPIDYLAFPGLRATGQVQSINLLEIKTGANQLSKAQKAIADVVAAGRVEFSPLTGEGHDDSALW
jgi:predicted Holliday junction resolvase-like endonuclease